MVLPFLLCLVYVLQYTDLVPRAPSCNGPYTTSMIRLLSLSLLLVTVLFSGVSYGDTVVQWNLIKNGQTVRVLGNGDSVLRDGNWACSLDAATVTDGSYWREMHCRNIVSGAELFDATACGEKINSNTTGIFQINGNQYSLSCNVLYSK